MKDRHGKADCRRIKEQVDEGSARDIGGMGGSIQK